jgi:hypothetical protein
MLIPYKAFKINILAGIPVGALVDHMLHKKIYASYFFHLSLPFYLVLSFGDFYAISEKEFFGVFTNDVFQLLGA